MLYLQMKQIDSNTIGNRSFTFFQNFCRKISKTFVRQLQIAGLFKALGLNVFTALE